MAANSVTEALNQRIHEYESIIEEMVSTSKKIGTIVSGPFNEKNKIFYRVREGSTELMLASNVKEKIEPETEVVIQDSFIARVLPKALIVVKETAPFKHIHWDEIGGLKSQISEIRKHIEGPLLNAKLYTEFGIEPSKGALLYGPPGCGKTLISKVIASKIIDSKTGTSDAFVYIKGPELLGRYVGTAEEQIRTMFSNCRKYTKKTNSRSVIFIDEADALLSRRGSGISSDVNTTIVPQFLSEMDGFDENSPFVLLSTNLPNSLDPAVIREGRIDLKIEIKRPSQSDSVEIFNVHLKKVKRHDDIDMLSNDSAKVLFEKTDKVSGAMIKTIVNSAAQESLHRHLAGNGKKGLTMDDIKVAVTKIVQSQIA